MQQPPFGQPPSVPRQLAIPKVEICRRCGIVAPRQASACVLCQQPLAQTRVAVPAFSPELQWAAVRVTFVCNSCRFSAPLDGLDTDGAVECAQCGLRQRFDVPIWRSVIEHVHAVVDLAGPGPEGRMPHPGLWIGTDNPFAAIGESAAMEATDLMATPTLHLEAGPGHPTCRRCFQPVTVQAPSAGTIQTSCPSCGERGTYSMGAAGQQLHPALMGVVSDDHHTDRTRLDAALMPQGVTALKCPQCGAPLQVSGTSRLQTCPFCQASCVIPHGSFSRARNEIPAPEVWWMLLRGISSRRLQLEAVTYPASSTGKQVASNIFLPAKPPPEVGVQPGVYEAPEPKGINWPQVALTAAASVVALLIGWLVAHR